MRTCQMCKMLLAKKMKGKDMNNFISRMSLSKFKMKSPSLMRRLADMLTGKRIRALIVCYNPFCRNIEVIRR